MFITEMLTGSVLQPFLYILKVNIQSSQFTFSFLNKIYCKIMNGCMMNKKLDRNIEWRLTLYFCLLMKIYFINLFGDP